MTQKKIGVVEIRLVFETDNGNFTRTDIHMMDRITEALAKVQNVNIFAAFFAEDGRRKRYVELTPASDAMKKVASVELGSDEVVA